MKQLLLVPDAEQRNKLLYPGLTGIPIPGAWLKPEIYEEHDICYDCDALSEEHRDEDAPSHCAYCHETWPCGQISKIAEPACWMLTLDHPTALVLIWNGQVIPEGCDRLRRVLGHHQDERLQAAYSETDARNGAERYVKRLGGFLVESR